MHPNWTRIIVFSSALVALISGNAFAGGGLSPLPVNENVFYTAAHVPQDFLIVQPSGYLIEFLLEGADGGSATTGTNNQCFSDGGKGAVVGGTFKVGTGPGELAPGGTIRFIIGQKGSDSDRTNDACGAGGGGSAILYLPPGGSWATPYGQPGSGEILLAAGAGGGATQRALLIGQSCESGFAGGNGVQTECGGSSEGTNPGTPGCDGLASTDNGMTGGYGGSGAFSAYSSFETQGYPNGGNADPDPVDGELAGWGFGPGGYGDYTPGVNGGGGGGGYSGGAGGGRNRYGGGGGSFYASFATNTTFSNDELFGSNGNGVAFIACAQAPNSEPEAAISFSAGTSLVGLPCFPDFNAIAIPCDASFLSGDVWYRYVNPNMACTQTLTFTWATPETAVSAHSLADPSTTIACSNGGQFTYEIAAADSVLIRVESGLAGFDVQTAASNPDPSGNGVCNDLCANASPLVDGTTQDSLANANNETLPSCVTGGEFPGDVWYTYTNTGTCPALILVSTCFGNSANQERTLTAYDGCNGSELVCDSGDGNDPCAEIQWMVPVGATHVLRVSRPPFTNPADEFGLTVSIIGADDRDGDGVEDACDNCLNTQNSNQVDTDNDGSGDACDVCPGFDDSIDADADTVPDGCDICAGFDDLMDSDGDGVPDGCDPCPNNDPDDVDGNGTCGGQVVISGNLQTGVTATGNLQPPSAIANQACTTDEPGTFDFWTFQATAGDTIMLELDRLDPDLEPVFSIWAGDLADAPLDQFVSATVNPNQTLVTLATDIEPPATVENGVVQGSGFDQAIVGFVAPNTGTYTVLVAGSCNAAADDNSYSIRLDLNAEATIRNITIDVVYSDLQTAISNALSGHIIEISAGVVFEDQVFWLGDKEITIRGAGPGLTVIDAEGISTASLITFGTGLGPAAVLSDLTLRKDAVTANQSGALDIFNSSPTIRNVTFEGNYGSATPASGAIDISVSGASSSPLIEQCVFLDGRAGFANVEVSDGASATLINCAFDRSDRLDGSIITSIAAESGTVNLVNCTVGGLMNLGTATVNALNTAFVETPPVGFALNRCLHPGATGNSIDGMPTFVDLAGNDLRLAAGSLGIDAADYDAYIASGGGNVDAGGQARAFDDAGTANTGSGVLTFLDIGAYEYFIDSDGDGVGDGSDVCPGFDDGLDADVDGTPDGCDVCPFDANDDSDGDSICDSEDVCPGFDDTVDLDNNGLPDCTEVAGDECAMAIDASDGTFIGTMAANSGSTGDDSSCASNDTLDKWFRYVPAVTGSLEVSTCNPGTEFDTVLSVFDDCPQSGGVQLSCQDDSADANCQLSGLNRKSTITLPITTGVAVYVRLSVFNDNFFGSNGTGAGYEISFTASTDPGGDGDECASARNAVVGVNAGTLVDNSGATGVDDSCGIFNAIDEWFRYTATVAGTVTISTCNPVTGFDSVLSVFDDCPGNGGIELGCNDDGPDPVACDIFGEQLLSTLEVNVTAGQIYYIRLSANFDSPFEPAGPEFELTIEEPTSGCTPGDADGNGAVDINDVAPFVAVVLDPTSATEDQQCTADVNEDDSIDGRDLQAFLDVILAP